MPDVVALQELTPAVADALEGSAEIDAAYPYRMLEPRDDVRGMGILSSIPLVKGAYGAFPMLLTADLLLPDDTRVSLLDVHPFPPKVSTIAGIPWGIDTRQRDEELESLRASVERAPDQARVILVGDLNTTPFEPGFGIVADGLVRRPRADRVRHRLHVAAGMARAAQRGPAPDRPCPHGVGDRARSPWTRTAASPATTAGSPCCWRSRPPTRSRVRRPAPGRGGRRR